MVLNQVPKRQHRHFAAGRKGFKATGPTTHGEGVNAFFKGQPQGGHEHPRTQDQEELFLLAMWGFMVLHSMVNTVNTPV